MKAYQPYPHTKKISRRTLEGEQNILQAHTPRKKIHGELRGRKKITAILFSLCDNRIFLTGFLKVKAYFVE